MYFTWSDDANQGVIDNLDLKTKPKLGFSYTWFHAANDEFLINNNGSTRTMTESQINKTKACYDKLIKKLLLVDDSSKINTVKE